MKFETQKESEKKPDPKVLRIQEEVKHVSLELATKKNAFGYCFVEIDGVGESFREAIPMFNDDETMGLTEDYVYDLGEKFYDTLNKKDLLNKVQAVNVVVKPSYEIPVDKWTVNGILIRRLGVKEAMVSARQTLDSLAQKDIFIMTPSMEEEILQDTADIARWLLNTFIHGYVSY